MANKSRPLVASCPAIGKVNIWQRIFRSSNRSPLFCPRLRAYALNVTLARGTVGGLTPLLDETIDHLSHVIDVGGISTIARDAELVLDRESLRLLHRARKRVHRRVDEGMVALALKGIEAVIEAGKVQSCRASTTPCPAHVDFVVGMEPRPVVARHPASSSGRIASRASQDSAARCCAPLSSLALACAQ
jgi:hypothetical protein